MASEACPLPEKTSQPEEPSMEKIKSDKAKAKLKKKRQKARQRRNMRWGVYNSETPPGIERKAYKTAKERRRKLCEIISSKDKMGLTKLGVQQLKKYASKKTPEDERPVLADLDETAKKVVKEILGEEEYDKGVAWANMSDPGEIPEEESEKETSLGEKEEKGEAQKEMEDWEGEWDQAPEPVSEENAEAQEEMEDWDEEWDQAPEPVSEPEAP